MSTDPNRGWITTFFFWLIPLLAGAALTTWLVNPGVAVVPNVVGKSSNTAITEIISSGFVPYLTSEEGGIANLVTAEAPKAGELHRKGSTIALAVSKGSEPTRVVPTQPAPSPEEKTTKTQPPPNLVHTEQSPAKGPEAIKLSPPGTVKVNPKDGLKYVWIPPGTFMMGCSPGDRCRADEIPHRVTISNGFLLGQTEVTQAAYERMTKTNPSHFRGENLPVEDVSWSEANSFCQAIGGGLPTEAEWEWAVRAGTSEARYGPVDLIAWSGDNSGGETHPVGTKWPNSWNLYDMLGNVWEWVADFRGPYESASVVDPKGPPTGSTHTKRGGGWHSATDGGYVRASSRSDPDPGNGPPGNVGFRCVAGF